MPTKFIFYVKNGIYSLELCIINGCTNCFKSIPSFLAVQWQRNQVNVMTSLFLNMIFGMFNYPTSKRLIFFESCDKPGQDSYIFKRKFWV